MLTSFVRVRDLRVRDIQSEILRERESEKESERERESELGWKRSLQVWGDKRKRRFERLDNVRTDKWATELFEINIKGPCMSKRERERLRIK